MHHFTKTTCAVLLLISSLNYSCYLGPESIELISSTGNNHAEIISRVSQILETNKFEDLEKFKEYWPDIINHKYQNLSLLAYAAICGAKDQTASKPDLIAYLLQKGASIDQQELKEVSIFASVLYQAITKLLFTVAKKSNEKEMMLNKLIALKVPLDIIDQNGNNLLHFAIASQDNILIKLLIINAAYLLEKPNKNNITPFEILASYEIYRPVLHDLLKTAYLLNPGYLDNKEQKTFAHSSNSSL